MPTQNDFSPSLSPTQCATYSPQGNCGYRVFTLEAVQKHTSVLSQRFL